MTMSFLQREGACGDPVVNSAPWHVTVTTTRTTFEPPSDVPREVEFSAEALGIDLRVDTQHCVARFFVHGPDLCAATLTAFERWRELQAELSLPCWELSSILVSKTVVAASKKAATRGIRDARQAVLARCKPLPGLRYPYYMWTPG